MLNDDEEDNVLFEEVVRYRLSVSTIDEHLTSTSHDLNKLIVIYNELVAENTNTNDFLEVRIFDVDKNINIYYYNSEDER